MGSDSNTGGGSVVSLIPIAIALTVLGGIFDDCDRVGQFALIAGSLTLGGILIVVLAVVLLATGELSVI